jgi:integrase
MYEGGLRISEVLSLWIDDLFLWDKRIRILPKYDLPNGARVKLRMEGFTDISSKFAELLDDYLLFNHPDCYDTSHLFVVEKGPNTGKPLSYNTVYKMFKYYSGISGVSLLMIIIFIKSFLRYSLYKLHIFVSLIFFGSLCNCLCWMNRAPGVLRRRINGV